MKTMKKVVKASTSKAKSVRSSVTSNALISALQATPTALTENGAITFNSTASTVLDFFSLGGALRQRSDADIVSLFTRAFGENRLLALKTLFYFRDVRGGQGERKVFRLCLKWLGENYPELVKANLDNVPFYGRYDDLFELFETLAENDVFEFVKNQLNKDIRQKDDTKLTLLAKWTPSINTSSQETVRLAKRLAKMLGWNPKKYRKTLSGLRARINVVEQKMCADEWKDIKYPHVPSRASLIYKKAFNRHDPEGYKKFLEKVASGKEKINAAALYPYDVIRDLRNAIGDNTALKTLDLQWKNLPDFLKDNPHNGLVVCDVSGSMLGGMNSVAPIDVSVSLAIYFAERNIGKFKDHFITFSGKPRLEKIVGDNIKEKFDNLCESHWEMNTDLQAVFNLILDAATRDKVPAKEMPSTLYIISDMEFDQAVSDNSKTGFQEIERKYQVAGYKLPAIVFWNVNAKQNQSPVTRDQHGVMLVSGASPSILQHVIDGSTLSPYEFMVDVLNSKRYDRVTLK